MKKIILIYSLCFGMLHGFAQSFKPDYLHFSGYLEVYYQYDLGMPPSHNRPPFVYSHNRTNEVNVNLGFLKAAMEKERLRVNFAIMTGTYANANLASEPGVLKNIYEGNIGLKISSKKNLWIDAGVFSSHLGLESAISKDCQSLTRSIIADNSPYYESGVKIGYSTNNDKWFLSLLFLNGWQRIQRVPENNTPAFGHQITFKPNENITLNSSSFIGSETPDSSRQMRYFHNFYTLIRINDKLNASLVWDIGFQQSAKNSNRYYPWSGGALILTTSPFPKINLSARTEYYRDIHNVIIPPLSQNGFHTLGYSLNLDYKILENTLLRIEGKTYRSPDAIFLLNKQQTEQNYTLTTSLAVSF